MAEDGDGDGNWRDPNDLLGNFISKWGFNFAVAPGACACPYPCAAFVCGLAHAPPLVLNTKAFRDAAHVRPKSAPIAPYLGFYLRKSRQRTSGGCTAAVDPGRGGVSAHCG